MKKKKKNVRKAMVILGIFIFSLLTFEYQTSKASTDSTASWKTYTDSVHNFSVQYPANFTYSGVDDTSKGIVNFEVDGPNKEQFFIYTNNQSGPYMPQETDVSDWVSNKLDWKTDAAEQTFQIAGMPALHASMNGIDNQFFFIKNGNMFHVTISGTNVNLNDSSSDVVNFLQSFKFTN